MTRASERMPFMPFYVGDHLSSSRVMGMTLEEQGAYHRLLCFAWEDGSLPKDLKLLAKLCGCSARKMIRLWSGIQGQFVEDTDGNLVNDKLESVRTQALELRSKRSRAGSVGAANRWQTDGKANGKTMPSRTKPKPDQSKQKEEPPPGDSSCRGKPDLAYEDFSSRYEVRFGAPYGEGSKEDWANLAALRKRYKTPANETPPRWGEATDNYFATPRGAYTIAEVCGKRYDALTRTPLDRYDKPVVSGNGSSGNQDRLGPQCLRSSHPSGICADDGCRYE